MNDSRDGWTEEMISVNGGNYYIAYRRVREMEWCDDSQYWTWEVADGVNRKYIGSGVSSSPSYCRDDAKRSLHSNTRFYER